MMVNLFSAPTLCYDHWETKCAHMYEIKQSIHYHVL